MARYTKIFGSSVIFILTCACNLLSNSGWLVGPLHIHVVKLGTNGYSFPLASNGSCTKLQFEELDYKPTKVD
ncbi:unnamed protein product [Lupinus luteus]|uniref:Uncharacterized protein n=1 Tax=Lupinus luteus TaxID=3873 RepID=A0AAV1XGN8_LUPLU